MILFPHDLHPLALLGLQLAGLYFVIITVWQLLLCGLALLALRRRYPEGDTHPSLTLLIAAKNESAGLVETVNRALQLPLENLHIVVIENASLDASLKLMQEFFQLRPSELPNVFTSLTHPRLRLMREPVAGKARALNTGLTLVETEFVASVDADTLVNASGIKKLLTYLQTKPELMAIGGVLDVQAQQGFLEKLQRVEYLRAFLAERTGLSVLKANVHLSGALAVFRTRALRAIGGFASTSITEDFESALALMKAAPKHPIEILPVIAATTQVPHTLTGLCRQRLRWQAGLAQCLWRYKILLTGPLTHFGRVITLPYLLVGELLGPLIELLAIAALAHALYYQLFSAQSALMIFAVGLILISLQNMALIKRFGRREKGMPNSFFVFFYGIFLMLLLRPLLLFPRVFALLTWPWQRKFKSAQRKPY